MEHLPSLYAATFSPSSVPRFIALTHAEMTDFISEISITLKWVKYGDPVTVKEVGPHINSMLLFGQSKECKKEIADYLQSDPVHHVSNGEWLISINGSEILMLPVLEILDQKILKHFTLPLETENEGCAYT